MALMLIPTGAMRRIKMAAAATSVLAAIACGGSNSPTGPTLTMTVVLATASVAAGATTQGTVSLSAPATATVNIALASSNSAVATVPDTVAIQAGSSSAIFTVTAVSSGTVTITATLNGSRGQSPTLTVTPRTALATISLSPSTVVEGSSSSGTVTLTAAAPVGGAVVALSGSDAVIMPSSITVATGATNATFPISTRSGGGAASVTITASYGGGSASAVLSITRSPVAVARFGITGPTETETCEMSNGGRQLSCTFDGRTSSAPGTIIAFDWSYSVAGTFAQTTSGPVLSNPAVDCSLLPPPPLPPGNPWFTLTVTLKIHDDRGNVAETTDRGARLLPHGTCGF
jgi:hypothetical protein